MNSQIEKKKSAPLGRRAAGYIPKPKAINKNICKHIKYQDENGLVYTEVIRQEYGNNNCIFSAGFVEGDNKPEVDIIYIRLEKDGVEPITLLLRPDEAQILVWVASGVVWSHLMDLMGTEDGG